MILTQKTVRELLSYDPKTGRLKWKPRSKKWFTDERGWNSWNTRCAHKPAFTATSHGYKVGNLLEKKYYAHRIIWLLVKGCWPQLEIDHKNHNGCDNRWDNLIETDHPGNGKNCSLSRANTSGHSGVGWQKTAQKFYAEIKVNHQKIHLGLFETLDSAIVARKLAERKYGFSTEHGKPR